MSFIYQYGCSDRESLMLDSVNVSFGLRIYPKWLPAVTLTRGYVKPERILGHYSSIVIFQHALLTFRIGS